MNAISQITQITQHYDTPTTHRFVSRLVVQEIGYETPCWRYTRTVNADGYGRFSNYGSIYAHRWLWTLVNGPIPMGLELDHKCNCRNCVNPNHLEAVTHQENVRRIALRHSN